MEKIPKIAVKIFGKKTLQRVFDWDPVSSPLEKGSIYSPSAANSVKIKAEKRNTLKTHKNIKNKKG